VKLKNKKMKSIPFDDTGDDMLDRDGMIVEPDVRKKVSKYFKAMGLREVTYSLRSTYFKNPYEDPGEEFDMLHDDPVGLKLSAKKRKMEKEIAGESLVRKLIGEMINESSDPPSLENLGIITFKYSFHSKLTVIYSIPALDWSLSRLFGTKVPKPNPDDLVVSGVQWGKPNGEGGPCNHAYVVRRSVTAFKGWGRKAYLAALADAGELGPDRDIVYPGAVKAWQRIVDAGYVEGHPYDDFKNPQTPPPEDDCDLHPGKPVLNASYELKGSTPSDILAMQERGRRHFEMLEKHGGKEIVDMARKVIGIEYDTIFRQKYESENF
jgi:hypothetical protein